LNASQSAVSDDAVWRAALAGVNSVEHAYQVADSTLALMAKNGVALVPTDLDSLSLLAYLAKQPRRAGEPPASAAQVSQFLASQRERLRRAVKAGVMIAAGSDNYIDFSPWPQGQAARHNLIAYAQAGLTPVQVLQAATLNAARLLGMENRIGVLKAGAFADIIAVDGDPGTDISAIEHVRFTMREGTVYLWPEAKAGR
jgi:imidazolonepropionase-like amidohydrolase